MGTLDGKVAVVTGAAQGIGAELARGLAAMGAMVVVSDVLDGAAVADEIKGAGGSAISLVTDVTSADSLTKMVEATIGAFGGIDILVNNAALFGKLPLAPMQEIQVEVWDRVMEVNVRGVWQASCAVLDSMKARGGGSIVNIATNRVFKGFPMMLHYDASKGAVVAMTKSMAVELGDLNIRVNAIAPGLTMSENVLAKDGIEDRKGAIAGARALKRDQQPEDLVGAVAFLASDQSSFMTGQTLVVDGGGIMR
ncbi:MAG: glucose 1-dehydrogenase [Alphaproteobacteria bacterium]|nr:MAG: glucose 1-dehydrogenase [Alphaproteobacteria bacterium]